MQANLRCPGERFSAQVGKLLWKWENTTQAPSTGEFSHFLWYTEILFSQCHSSHLLSATSAIILAGEQLFSIWWEIGGLFLQFWTEKNICARYMLLVELPLFARSGLGVGIGINTLMSSGFLTFTSYHKVWQSKILILLWLGFGISTLMSSGFNLSHIMSSKVWQSMILIFLSTGLGWTLLHLIWCQLSPVSNFHQTTFPSNISENLSLFQCHSWPTGCGQFPTARPLTPLCLRWPYSRIIDMDQSIKVLRPRGKLFQGLLSTLAGRKISVGVAGLAPALALVSNPQPE